MKQLSVLLLMLSSVVVVAQAGESVIVVDSSAKVDKNYVSKVHCTHCYYSDGEKRASLTLVCAVARADCSMLEPGGTFDIAPWPMKYPDAYHNGASSVRINGSNRSGVYFVLETL